MTISRSTILITADGSEAARTDSTPYSHYSLLGPDVYRGDWCTP